MALIDDTYFKGDISLSQNIYGTINDFLNNYEDMILDKLLGYDLKKNFLDGLEIVSPLQKWLDLRDGKTYTVTDRDNRTVNVKWNGLINAEKKSLLSYFIYYYYSIENQSFQSQTGDIIMMNENSNITPISQINGKLIRAYNRGCELYGKNLSIMTGRNAIIRSKRWQQTLNLEQLQIDYYQEILKGTAYNFIYFANEDVADTYPNWNFTEIKKINTFGI